jgi:hypothetical protein
MDPTLSKVLEKVALQKRKGQPNFYAPLDPEEAKLVRAHYEEQLRIPIIGTPHTLIKNRMDTVISRGYVRVVIGDYGAFIEFNDEQVQRQNLRPHFDGPPQSGVAYVWLETKDTLKTKIYEQKRTVRYADYTPGMFYVDPAKIEAARDPDFAAEHEFEWRVYYRIASTNHLLEAKRAEGGEPYGHTPGMGLKARPGEWLCRTIEQTHYWTMNDESFDMLYRLLSKSDLPPEVKKKKPRKRRVKKEEQHKGRKSQGASSHSPGNDTEGLPLFTEGNEDGARRTEPS